jgi:hypothetical protein
MREMKQQQDEKKIKEKHYQKPSKRCWTTEYAERLPQFLYSSENYKDSHTRHYIEEFIPKENIK